LRENLPRKIVVEVDAPVCPEEPISLLAVTEKPPLRLILAGGRAASTPKPMSPLIQTPGSRKAFPGTMMNTSVKAVPLRDTERETG
jgi:hypothetical protein